MIFLSTFMLSLVVANTILTIKTLGNAKLKIYYIKYFTFTILYVRSTLATFFLQFYINGNLMSEINKVINLNEHREFLSFISLCACSLN